MSKFLAGVKEFFRKRMVALKRKPQTIALLGLLAAFVYYSFNLTKISNTTAICQSPGVGMGLCAFVMMLLLVLVMVCFLNAFPHRKKVNIPMLVLMLLMMGIIIFCNFRYESGVDLAQQKRYDDEYNERITKDPEAYAEACEYLDEIKPKLAEVNAYLQAAEVEKQAIDIIVEQIKLAGGDATAVEAEAEKAVTAIGKLQEWSGTLTEAQTGIEEANNVSTLKSASRAAKNTLKNFKKIKYNKQHDNAVAARDAAEAAAVEAGLVLEELNLPVRVTIDETAGTVEPTSTETPQYIYDEAKAEADKAVKAFQEKNPDVVKAKSILRIHRIIMYIALALIVLLPVYKPLLRKVRTSIEVEATKEMGEIELDGSDE